MTPDVSSAHEMEVRGAVQRRSTPFGEFALAMIGQAMEDLSHQADEEDIASARHFLLDPDSPVDDWCELLAIDRVRLRRRALSRSARLEATRATLAAHNRQRGRERRGVAA